MLPRVRTKSENRTAKSRANAPSSMRRKVGFSDEPGVRIFEKNPPSEGSSGVVFEGSAGEDGAFASLAMEMVVG